MIFCRRHHNGSALVWLFFTVLFLFVNYIKTGTCTYILLKMGCRVFICVFVRLYLSLLLLRLIWNSTKNDSIYRLWEVIYIPKWICSLYIFTIYCSWAFEKGSSWKTCFIHCTCHFFSFFALYICSWEIVLQHFIFCLTCIIMLNKDSYFVLHTCNVESVIEFYFFNKIWKAKIIKVVCKPPPPLQKKKKVIWLKIRKKVYIYLLHKLNDCFVNKISNYGTFEMEK